MKWSYVVGISFNPVATSAVELAAWSNECRDLYHVSEFFGVGLGLDALAAEVHRLEKVTGGIVGYHGYAPGRNGKRIQEALQTQHSVPVEFAEKMDIGDYVELVNSDLVAGRMKIQGGTRLEAEMITLRRDKTQLELAEGQDAACTLAWILTWRNAYHRFGAPTEEKPRDFALEKEQRALAAIARGRQESDLDPQEWVYGGEKWRMQ